MTEQAVAIHFQNVSRFFGHVRAVDNITLDIYDGEFYTLLGPSGSGKTTCLRMIAGFEIPSAGHILLYDQDVTNLPPYERPVNTVFQDYALFPHMTVAENVGYSLMIKKTKAAEREARVGKMLDLVHLTGYEKRKPSQLSGGQRQRVALARALINQPRVLLLDEPLGALDLKLRQQMQTELKNIQNEVNITFIFVTHDQEEALSMSDRIAVFDAGRIVQVGTPSDLYERPATPFVASFVGTSNFLQGEEAVAITGSPDMFSVRPEKIRLSAPGIDPGTGMLCANGVIKEVVYLGLNTRFTVTLDCGGDMIVVEQNLDVPTGEERPALGRPVSLIWPRSANISFKNGAG